MGLSLAQSSRKTRISSDPRNTLWANDTDRFGHQQLLNMGWTPGKGLGCSVEGAREHIKVQHKTDSRGLGYEVGQADVPTGLDVFQRLLGRLNGKEEEVEAKLKHQRSMQGLYMHFVPGGVLKGTVKSKEEQKREKKKKERRQREKKPISKQLDKQKKKAERASLKEKKALKSKKKEKEKKVKEMPKTTVRLTKARGIRATRTRYIAMKRQATSDSKGLKEILMC